MSRKVQTLLATVGILFVSAAYAIKLPKLPKSVELPAMATLASETTDPELLQKLRDLAVQDHRKTYLLVADAIDARMHFQYASARSIAERCMQTAGAVGDPYATVHCGLIRMSLARFQLNLK